MDQNFNKVFWDACANGDFPMVCSQIKAGADVNYQNGDGRTALMRASKRDRKDVVQVLLFLRQREIVHYNRFKELFTYYKKRGY